MAPQESAKDMHAQLCACELLVGLPNTGSELSLYLHINREKGRSDWNSLVLWVRKSTKKFTPVVF